MKFAQPLVFAALLIATSAKASEMLVDFRDSNRNPNLSTVQFSEKKQANLLKALYPKPNEDGCREELWGNMQTVQGHFVDPLHVDIVAVFESTPCGNKDNTHGNIVLIRGKDILVWTNEGSFGQIEMVSDLNGDGLDDVVTSSLYGDEGYFSREASTVSFRGREITLLTEGAISGQVEVTSCEDLDNVAYSSAFFLEDGKIVQYNYWSPCSIERYHDYSKGPLIPNDWNNDGISDDDGG